MGTDTYATLEVSNAAFVEVRDLLEAAAYSHLFNAAINDAGTECVCINMNGLALIPRDPEETPVGWLPIAGAPTDGTEVDLWVVGADGEGERHTDMSYHAGGPGEDTDWDHEMYSLLGDRIVNSLEQVTHYALKLEGPQNAQ